MKKFFYIALIFSSVSAGEKDSSSYWRPNPILSAGLSFAIPGAGQIYNRSYWKAPIPIIAEGYAIWAIADAYAKMTDAEKRGREAPLNSQEYIDAKKDWEDSRERRNIHIWLLVGFVFLSTLDAYVDAQLYPWEREMNTPIESQKQKISLVPIFDSEKGLGVRMDYSW